MKTRLSMVLIFFVTLNFIFSGYVYERDEQVLNDSYFQIEIQDTVKSRYYEAPDGELPFGYFKIIDNGSIIVYSQKAHHPRYGSYLKYYYSINLKSRIHELTLENLEVDFTDNPKFIKLIKESKKLWQTMTNGITYLNKLWLESLK
ncbi:MAG TPA: hypothetical protein PK294_12410 [Ignavibacteria bacterium]|nr:hypothetical protein [Ignavibacteria bacterium]HQY53239.1 hypothetical protein [Ignavibacteria bacterium]HRB01229.1 hypothetical protein [Ignavibacteria bacterium]